MANAALLQKVLDTVQQVDGLWNQGVWRETPGQNSLEDFALSPEERQMVRELLGTNPNEDPQCGTAMCFAGWTAQLAEDGAQYLWPAGKTWEQIEPVVDQMDVSYSSVKELVVLPADHKYDLDKLDDLTTAKTPDGRQTVYVWQYAQLALDVSADDADALFGGDNDLEAIEAMVQRLIDGLPAVEPDDPEDDEDDDEPDDDEDEDDED
jgi:hypothetical protein